MQNPFDAVSCHESERQNGCTDCQNSSSRSKAEPEAAGVGRGRAGESGERVGGSRRAPELGLYLCAKDFDFSFIFFFFFMRVCFVS